MTTFRDRLLAFWNLWPPFLFTGIRVVKKSPDFRHITVKLKLRFWNANFVGTQFGGSLFMMGDPFYMIMLIKNLGPEYIVWDKTATIRYLKPGKTDVTAEFNLSAADLELIKKTVQEQGKMHWECKIEIKDVHGEVIAEMERLLSIRLKRCEILTMRNG